MSLVLASLRNHTPLKDTSNLGDARENQATKSFLLKTNTQVSVDRPVALPFGIVNTRSLYNIPNSISDQNLLAN
ncbi:hypothetical protein GW750_06315 [bacterium]|nr:hypothetical protein [bacterium]